MREQPVAVFKGSMTGVYPASCSLSLAFSPTSFLHTSACNPACTISTRSSSGGPSITLWYVFRGMYVPHPILPGYFATNSVESVATPKHRNNRSLHLYQFQCQAAPAGVYVVEDTQKISLIKKSRTPTLSTPCHAILYNIIPAPAVQVEVIYIVHPTPLNAALPLLYQPLQSRFLINIITKRIKPYIFDVFIILKGTWPQIRMRRHNVPMLASLTLTIRAQILQDFVGSIKNGDVVHRVSIKDLLRMPWIYCARGHKIGYLTIC